ncbi:MAG: PHP domain-containing protein [Candidatus Micrarchaeota archaeon]|nr:PHP domain-containing protein [Candidatus Micrarchaeota archaeon]
MRFELHCHSYYSKGEKIPREALPSPREIAKRVSALGFQGFALTDHKVTTGLEEAKKAARKFGLVFIPGVEIQTREGHLIALGINEPVKNGLSLDETLDEIKSQGAISVAPHPYDIKGEGIKDGIKKVDVVEVFNSLNIDKLANLVSRYKVRRLGKPCVCGSDAHTLEMIGTCFNEIDAWDCDSALVEIKAGRVLRTERYTPLSVIVNWSRKRLEASYQDVIDYINRNYRFPKNRIAAYLLRKFVNSESRIWNVLAHLSLNLSRIYGGFKILTYF